MKFDIIKLNTQDEAEFLPIIPLNEGDIDTDEKLVIPNDLPILPLRNTVLFPGVVIPITVGREKSIKAVTDAYKGDKLVGVLTQKDANLEDPATRDLFSIGTVARIVKLIKMPDGGTTIIIQGKKRFELLSIITEDPYYKAAVKLLEDDLSVINKEFDAVTATIKDLATQIIQTSPNLPTEATIILKNIENASFLINFVSSNLNCELLEKQSLLEINNIKD